jgi:Type I phosphodiesterase / nucleotide pyrophosphatase
MIDDFVLLLQGLVDRVARWVRLTRTAEIPRRRFLIIQIDGLSREVFESAFRAGAIPNTARLIASGRYVQRPMSVGLPSSTPAFQAAAMYGIKPDIPGFHYYDKRTQRELHFPEPGVADFVEARHAAGRLGILEGGSCYGCVFTGGADNSLLTFSRLMKPTRAGLPLLRLGPSTVLLGWVITKCIWLTAVELTRFLIRLASHPRRAGPEGLRWLGLKIVFSVWMRELFTLSVSADLYRGVSAVYVNYLDYDVFAHAFGPTHKSARRALRHIDNAIGQLVRILERLPELEYDLYILSDHGQTITRPFVQVSGGRTLDEVIRSILGSRPGRNGKRNISMARQLAGYKRREKRGLLQRFFNHMERGHHVEVRRDDTVRVITAGPNAFVYFLDSPEPLLIEDIEARYPGAAVLLSKHPGVGLVLARSAAGPLCWWRGREVSLEHEASDGPFANRKERNLVLEGLRDLMAMPSAGDLVVYGIGAPENDVSFMEERGAHAGPSEHEMRTFFIHPEAVSAPASLNHPIELYAHFAAYRDGGSATAS